MRRISRVVGRGGLAAALLLGAVVAQGSVVPAPDELAGRVQPTFRIRGHVAGLIPGEPTRMRVQVVNRYGFPIRVTRVGARIVSATTACPPSNLAVRQWRGVRRVPADGRRHVALRVTLRKGAPVTCAGVRFRLHYTGRAGKVGSR